MTYSDELRESIDSLIHKTRVNEFSWVRENPTTFYFEQSYKGKNSIVQEKFLVSIQKVELSRHLNKSWEKTDFSQSVNLKPNRYILQIKDIDLNRIDLKVDTLNKHYGEEVYAALEQLYETIISQLDSRSLEVFHKVLGNV